MEHLGPHAQGVGEIVRAHGHDHEFLEIDGVVRVRPAVDDVHHRHRQVAGEGAADIAVQGQARLLRRRLGGGQADAQDGVGAEACLVRRAVQLDHHVVDEQLILDIRTGQGITDFAVHGVDGGQHALAQIARIVAVAQFDGLVRPGRGPRRDGGAAEHARFQGHVHFHGGIAAGIEDFTGEYVDDGSHVSLRSGRPAGPSGGVSGAGRYRETGWALASRSNAASVSSTPGMSVR